MKRLFAASLLCLVSGGAYCDDEPPFTITVKTSSTARLAGDKFAPMLREGVETAEATAKGSESSQCETYGRASHAYAKAASRSSRPSADRVDIDLQAHANALGGHFRDCGGCVAGKCVFTHGNDTSTQAEARAHARVTISFGRTYPPTDYVLDFSSSASTGLVTKLVDGAGNDLPLRRANGDPQILHGKPGGNYFLDLLLPVTALDKGGCCSDEKSASVSVAAGLRLERAPILDARKTIVPFIAGGDQTSAYPNVGAILLGGKLHCTGTLIGKTTVLTAGHCIYGFSDRLATIGTFTLGSNILQFDHPYRVAGSDYPIQPSAPYSYDPHNYDNDVGLVYLAEVVPVGPAELHGGQPPWPDLVKNKTNLTFVGFGYDFIQQQKVADGIKREGSWYISDITDRTARFRVPGKNTCKGDSGGPAFLIGAGKIVQVAVTSGGLTDSCEDGGVESRVDFFLSWISPRIR